MIVVTIDLQSAVSPTKNKNLGVMVIANDGTGTQTIGNYAYSFMGTNRKEYKVGKVKGYKRKRDSVFKLIAMCLKDAGYIK